MRYRSSRDVLAVIDSLEKRFGSVDAPENH